LVNSWATPLDKLATEDRKEGTAHSFFTNPLALLGTVWSSSIGCRSGTLGWLLALSALLQVCCCCSAVLQVQGGCSCRYVLPIGFALLQVGLLLLCRLLLCRLLLCRLLLCRLLAVPQVQGGCSCR
jgi:hypothetical protein